MASFEYIDELAASVTSTSSFSDFDVWSPTEDQRPKVSSKATQSMKDRFLSHLKEKNLLSIRARRASAESLSSNLISPKAELTTSFSVTETLNRIDQKPDPIMEQQENNSKQTANNGATFRTRQRNTGTRQSKLVRQS